MQAGLSHTDLVKRFTEFFHKALTSPNASNIDGKFVAQAYTEGFMVRLFITHNYYSAILGYYNVQQGYFFSCWFICDKNTGCLGCYLLKISTYTAITTL